MHSNISTLTHFEWAGETDSAGTSHHWLGERTRAPSATHQSSHQVPSRLVWELTEACLVSYISYTSLSSDQTSRR